MHGLQSTPTPACPGWCTTDHQLDATCDSASFAFPQTGAAGSLFLRLTQDPSAPVLVEMQDDRKTVARLSKRDALALSRLLFQLAKW